MTVFVTSDNHFNHTNIIKFCDRPFESLKHMNMAMVAAWNDVVAPKDTVHVLGDFGYVAKNNPEAWDIQVLFASLNGHKHLTIGNHDEQNPAVLKLPWESQADLRTIKDNGRKAVACHYPLETWKTPNRYAMLHGHSHGTLKRRMGRRQDVGVDVLGFAPVEFVPLVDRLMAEPFSEVDHHGKRSEHEEQ